MAAARSRNTNKAKMLVVDDEPDNLDLLYRTFRRDFNVLRAESGHQALEVLAEHGEVAVIISDQRMPEMKGTEFLSKTVPEFPDTVRIILTGFTDVEDLVDAINAGQVYRYITKPWNPDELKLVVDQAASTYDLLKQRGEAIDLLQNQHWLVMEMANIAQSQETVVTALPAIAAALQKVTAADGAAVHLVEGDTLGDDMGTAGAIAPILLKQDPLIAEAITAQQLKFMPNAAKVSDSTSKELYETHQVGAHGGVPVLFRGAVVAVISLQWQSPHEFTKTLQDFLGMASHQVALTLACL
ncbi:response regulator [Leptolyngbya iicbica]|uniref:Response regulator n=2 Tax=Cyanophyceae TaxID=3028117 RepID=A0A4Q7E8V6_9CYAN|nr:response regulator [Leptolyngbya sp. LK]RZM78951.1 response regulator [Leptolyngbya sp. LK]